MTALPNPEEMLVPDPERVPDHDHALYRSLMAHLPRVFRTGRLQSDNERHDAFKVGDGNGTTVHVVSIEGDEEDPEMNQGLMINVTDGGVVGEPRRVRFKRLVEESKPIQFFEYLEGKAQEHPKGTVASAAVVGFTVAVGTLVARHKHKKD